MKKSGLALLLVAVMAGASGAAFAAKKAPAAPKMSETELQAYRDGFTEANTVADLELFVEFFAKNDPEKLVPKAKAKMEELKKQEAAAAAEAAAPAASAPAAAPAQ